MRKLFIVFAAIIAVLGAQAQRNCGSMEVLERLKTEDPSYAAKMGEIEEHTAEFVRNHQGSTEAVITIPVVIHLLYNTSVQNITDAQILSQMDVLNEDFRLLNADNVNTPSVFAGLKADCEINFVLAKRDPNGNATTGIIRKSTTVTSWSSNDYVKYSSRGGDDAWPAGSYLNIWVCNLGGGLLGYAQFPGGSAITDGVVVGYQYFGRTGTLSAPFNKGRTATHEVGHWLNLRHIWGDANCGNDLVDDTPTQQTSNYGCPTHPKVTCQNVNGDLFMNYMDYSDDACMYMFTAKQKLRMQAVLAAGGSRATLATSLGGTAPTGGTTCSAPNGLTSSNVANTTATLNWNSTGAASYNVQYKLATATTWTTASTTATSLALTGLTAGTSYQFQVQSVCTGGTTSAYSATVTFSTLSSTGCGVDAFESNNTAATANAVSVSATVAGVRNGLICPAGDIDWFKFNTLSTAKNIKVTLTNLPADYDIYLYRSTSTTKVLKSSVKTGTTSESLSLNNGTVGTYLVKVQGYNNATNASGQYTLTIQIGSATFRMNQDGTQQTISGSDEESLNNVNIYPNPANSMVNLEFNATQAGQAQIRFIDQMGRVAQTYYQTTTAGNNLMNLDINAVPAGVYFVQMISNEQTITKRLVISH